MKDDIRYGRISVSVLLKETCHAIFSCKGLSDHFIKPVNQVCNFLYFRLLFPANEVLAAELFRLSGVDDTLRPQQLSLDHFEQLCNAYVMLMRDQLENFAVQAPMVQKSTPPALVNRQP